MEEIRSTDVLDSKIRADSKKKASDVLARAEENAKAILGEVQDRILKAKEEIDAASKNRLGILEKNLDASLPLEKQRYLVSFIDASIVEAMKKYFDDLDSPKKEQLIENLAKRAKSVTGDSIVTAVACKKMPVKDAEKILKNVFGKSLLKVDETPGIADAVFQDYGVMLYTEDKKIKCTLTLEEISNELLGQNREKLALALFGGRLPE